MKKLRYLRHLPFSPKRGISQKNLDRAQLEAPRGDYTDVFYGPLYRTPQTALAIVAGLEARPWVHQTIQEIGDGATIDSALNILKLMDQGKKQTDTTLFEKYVLNGLRKMFNLLNKEGYGLAIGHGPIIELTYRHFGDYYKRKIGNFEFVDFIQDETGKISVVKS